MNNLTNQSLSNSINIVNNQTLNNHINSVSANNQTLNNPINNIINLTKQFNNSLLNSTHNLRNLELKNSNSSYLRDFYLACDRKILIIYKYYFD